MKRLPIHISACNLGLLMRQVVGVGTPPGLQGRLSPIVAALLALMGSLSELVTRHGRSVRQVSPLKREIRLLHIAVRDMAFTTGC